MLKQVIPVPHMTKPRSRKRSTRDNSGFALTSRFPQRPITVPLVTWDLSDDVLLHLLSHAGDGVVGGVVYILVDNVDALHAEFVDRGVPIHIEPTDQTWGMREMYVRDPDGNSVRFDCPVAAT